MIEPKLTPMLAHTSELPQSGPGRVLLFKPLAPSIRKKPRVESFGMMFTWEALERQLCDLAVTPAQKRLAPSLVSATRKQASFKPSEQVLREVLCIASVLMDEAFHPASEPPESEEAAMS
jgi:hypothetical protein